jgi:hypothetical protein
VQRSVPSLRSESARTPMADADAAAGAAAAVKALAAAAIGAPSFAPVVQTLEAHAAAQPQLGAR